jgi:hypothetical protein
MDYEESFAEAARREDEAVSDTISTHRRGHVVDEDDMTAFLIGALSVKMQGTIGNLSWSASVLRHRKGVAAEEKAFGADILIHVALKAADLEYSKGVLVQAKNFDRHLFARERQRFVDQCDKMLVVTPASFVFGYSRRGMRCGSAVTMVSTTSPALFEQCVWTSYRFFLELFRCPIGDRRITSANVADLPVPNVIRIRGSGGGAET